MGLIYAICQHKDNAAKIIHMPFPCKFEAENIKNHIEKQHPSLKLIDIRKEKKQTT